MLVNGTDAHAYWSNLSAVDGYRQMSNPGSRYRPQKDSFIGASGRRVYRSPLTDPDLFLGDRSQPLGQVFDRLHHLYQTASEEGAFSPFKVSMSDLHIASQEILGYLKNPKLKHRAQDLDLLLQSILAFQKPSLVYAFFIGMNSRRAEKGGVKNLYARKIQEYAEPGLKLADGSRLKVSVPDMEGVFLLNANMMQQMFNSGLPAEQLPDARQMATDFLDEAEFIRKMLVEHPDVLSRYQSEHLLSRIPQWRQSFRFPEQRFILTAWMDRWTQQLTQWGQQGLPILNKIRDTFSAPVLRGL